jgi:hypothetical protein
MQVNILALSATLAAGFMFIGYDETTAPLTRPLGASGISERRLIFEIRRQRLVEDACASILSTPVYELGPPLLVQYSGSSVPALQSTAAVSLHGTLPMHGASGVGKRTPGCKFTIAV